MKTITSIRPTMILKVRNQCLVFGADPTADPAASIQRSKKKSAWLIMWNATNDAHLASLRRPRIVAILDHRISEKKIRQYLKLLYYSDQNLSPSSKNHEMHLHSIRRLKDARWKDADSGDGTLLFGSFSPWIEFIARNCN